MAEESPIKMMPTDEVIDAKIEAALEEPLRTLEEHGEALTGKADGDNVYNKTTVDAKVKTVADAVAEHVGDTTHHITAQERETWNNKPDGSTFYSKTQSDQRFAVKSVEQDVANLGTNKADKNNVYTKSEMDTALGQKCDKANYSTTSQMNTAISQAITGALSGKTFDLRNDDGIYAAIKAIGQAFGATIVE